jgi:predicted metalloprotease with PDZ domain
MRQTLHYCVDPFDPAGHRLRVTLRIPRPDPKLQVVNLPAWIPGSYLIRDFSRHIETIRARSGNRTLPAQKLGSHQWGFAGCTSALSVEIVVYAWDLSVRGAHVDESHAFFNGTSVFLCAEGLEQAPCVVEVLAPPHTKRWRGFTSMPQTARASGKSLGTYTAPDYDALIDHPFELGTPQVVSFRAGGAPHELIFTGAVPGLDLQRIARDAKRICEAQIALFEPESKTAPFLDSAQKYVFMTMVTSDGYGGLEHRASTALVTSRKDLPVQAQAKAPEGYTTFLGLLSHEYFHTWHVKRIKPAAFAPYDLQVQNHTTLLWIFEGFTSYYDDLMLVRSGVIDQATYLKQLAKTVTAVQTGSGRQKQSLAESSFDAWTKYYKQDENAPNAIVSYYAKGSLVALGLDLTIRQQSAGRSCLDDVMRALWHQFGRDFYRGQARGLNEDAFTKIVLEATGVDVSLEINHWVDGVADVPLADLLKPEGFDLTWKATDTTATLGATYKTVGHWLALRQVHEGSAAHRAGLSANDKLVAIDGLQVGNTASCLTQLLKSHKAGDNIRIHAFRDDVLLALDATLAPSPESTCEIKPVNAVTPTTQVI